MSQLTCLKVLGLEVSPIYLNELSEPESSGDRESRLCRTGIQKSLGEAGVAMPAHLHMHLTAAKSQQLPLLGDTMRRCSVIKLVIETCYAFGGKGDACFALCF